MADNDNKLNLETDDLKKNQRSDSGSKSSESDLEIKNVSSTNSDVTKKDNKLTINLETKLPVNDIDNAVAETLELANALENDDDETINQPTDLSPRESTPEIPEPNSEEIIPEPEAEEISSEHPKETPITTPNTPVTPEQPKQNQQPTGQETKSEDTQKNNNDTSEPALANPPTTTNPKEKLSDPSASPQNPIQPPATENPFDKEQSQPPTSVQNQKNPPQTAASVPQENPEINHRPPTVPKEELSNIGPHGTSGAANSLADPTKKDNSNQNQNPTNSHLNTIPNNQPPTSPPSLKDNLKNKAQQGLNNIKSDFQSDRSRKRQLGQRRRQLETELKKLDNKVDSVKSSLAMQIIRFWLPTLYSTIMGLTFGIKNVQGQAKIKMLQTKIVTLETLHKSLQTAEAGSAVIDSSIKVARFAFSIGPPTFFIGTLIILIISPIIVLFLSSIMYILKQGGIIPAIEKIDKEVRNIKEQLERTLQPEQQKVRARQEIQKVNQLMAADSQTRKDYQTNQQNNGNNSASTNRTDLPKNPAANDNTESTALPKAA